MRRNACAAGVGLVLTAALSFVSAQSWSPPPANCPPPTVPPHYSQGAPYSGPSGQQYSPTAPGYPTPSNTLPSATPPRPSSNAPGGGQTSPSAAQPAATPNMGFGAAAPSDTGAAESRGESGSDALASAAPQMIGDLIGGGAGGVTRISTAPGRQAFIRSVLASRSGLKIADNESPRPRDRAFVTFNYFNGVNTFGAENYGLYRTLIGFEKTFLDGKASVGMRLPFVQGDQKGQQGVDGFGDLTIIAKYAFYNDTDTGDVLSAGLALTAPTGLDFRLADGNTVSSVILQPWGGFIYSFDDIYTQGFTSIIIPTQAKDITIYTLDVGVGYRLWRASDDGWLRAIIPTLEAHMNVPLTASGPESLLYFPDILMSVTGGIHFGVGDNAWFTMAAGVPFTGPRLYDAEFITQLNMRY